VDGSYSGRATDALRTALDFAGLDEQTLDGLADAASLLRLAAGETVFEKGSSPDALYVVVSGRVAIVDAIHGEEREIAVIDPGDFFGELSLALHTTRTRTARARQPSELLVVPRAAFDELSKAHPGLPARIVDAFSERMVRREDPAG
jgi:CRP/FNR family cyclic AMP-dependent transcriptional regulator